MQMFLARQIVRHRTVRIAVHIICALRNGRWKWHMSHLA